MVLNKYCITKFVKRVDSKYACHTQTYTDTCKKGTTSDLKG